jgi:hypothetical protein
MSTDDPKKKTPADAPPEPIPYIPRSGSGAGTALVAMLKKRQMRVTRDTETPAPDDGAKKPANE